MFLKLWTAAVSRVDNEQGASLVEYALLVALIALIAIAAVTTVGNNLDTTFTEIANEIPGGG